MNKRIILYILLAIIAVFCMSLKPKEIKQMEIEREERNGSGYQEKQEFITDS